MASWPYEPQTPRTRRRRTLTGGLVYLGALALCLAAWYIIVAGIIGLFG